MGHAIVRATRGVRLVSPPLCGILGRVLTTARSADVRNATRDGIDMEGAVWRLPMGVGRSDGMLSSG